MPVYSRTSVLAAGCRSAVQAADQNPCNCSFNVAALSIRWIAWPRTARHDGIRSASQDCDPVPTALALPHSPVPDIAQGSFGEVRLARLQFLQTNHVRLGLVQPIQQMRKPPVDVVDIEGGDLQRHPPGDGWSRYSKQPATRRTIDRPTYAAPVPSCTLTVPLTPKLNNQAQL
jgi:hypothetical protein